MTTRDMYRQRLSVAADINATFDVVRDLVESAGVETAVAWADQWGASPDCDDRIAALDVLAGVAQWDAAAAAQAILDQAGEVSAQDASDALRWSAVHALSRLGASATNPIKDTTRQAALVMLMRFERDPDVFVRRQFVFGLPGLAGQSPSPSHPAIEALLRGFQDEDPQVRDWAAFGIGLCEVDAPAVRDGLLLLTADPEGDTAGEAAAALAALGDVRVLPVVLEHLTRDDVGNLWLEAAAALPDPMFLPALLKLRAAGSFDHDPFGHEWLQQAVARALAATSGP